MNSPQISVIIPVYNAEKYLKRCIESVAAQSFTDYEVLFIDDRSSDSSREIIKFSQIDDPRIKLIEFTQNCGSGVARNAGIETARGEYLSFIDADDTISPDFLYLLYKKAKQTCADVVMGSYVISSDGERFNTVSVSPRTIKAEYDRGAKLYNTFINGHSRALYKRSFIRNHFIRYGSARISHDVVFLLQAGYFARSFEIEPSAEYRYFINSGSAVRTFSYERFRSSMLAVGEIIDFINKNDPYSDELASFLTSFLMRQLPVHSYLCTQPDLRDKASGFLEELRGSIMRCKNVNTLMRLNYAVRVLIEFSGKDNIAPDGMIVGLDHNIPWRLYAFQKLIEHLNAGCSDKTAGAVYLCSVLANIDRRLTRDEMSVCPETLREFYSKLHGLLLELNDKEPFIKRGGIAARAMLDYGVNLFFLKTSDPIVDTGIKLGVLKRSLDLIQAHPEASNDYTNYAKRIADKLLDRICLLQTRSSVHAAKLSFDLSKQIKRINALD